MVYITCADDNLLGDAAIRQGIFDEEWQGRPYTPRKVRVLARIYSCYTVSSLKRCDAVYSDVTFPDHLITYYLLN